MERRILDSRQEIHQEKAPSVASLEKNVDVEEVVDVNKTYTGLDRFIAEECINVLNSRKEAASHLQEEDSQKLLGLGLLRIVNLAPVRIFGQVFGRIIRRIPNTFGIRSH